MTRKIILCKCILNNFPPPEQHKHCLPEQVTSCFGTRKGISMENIPLKFWVHITPSNIFYCFNFALCWMPCNWNDNGDIDCTSCSSWACFVACFISVRKVDAFVRNLKQQKNSLQNDDYRRVPVVGINFKGNAAPCFCLQLVLWIFRSPDQRLVFNTRLELGLDAVYINTEESSVCLLARGRCRYRVSC